MTDNIIGCFAKSKAGHDKDVLCIIVDNDKKYVWLSDGKLKPVLRPKKKNRKHVQLVNEKDSDIEEKLNRQQPIVDEDIKKAIKKYMSK